MYMKISELLLAFLEFQHQMKVYHWQTKSFARHKASDELVDTFQDLTDKFVEAYQGKYERIVLDKHNRIVIDNTVDNDIIKYLDDMRTILTRDIPKVVKKEDTDLLTIRDEMLMLINKSSYLFTLE